MGRKRGGQPKNTNARKHGFYSSAFSKRVQKIYRAAVGLDPHDLSDEIAALRTELHVLIKVDKKNVKVVEGLARTLVRAIAVDYGMTPAEKDELSDSVRDLLRDLLPLAGGA